MKLVDKNFKEAIINKLYNLRDNMDIKDEQVRNLHREKQNLPKKKKGNVRTEKYIYVKFY